MADVVLDHIGKVYADGTRAVTDLSLSVEEGEFLVLVGPSGCGKTTALRMVAGLEGISEGTLRIGEKVMNAVPSRDRDVAMVFQSYALYPHLTVRDNIGFGLALRKMPKREIRERVDKVAAVLGLTEHLDRRPKNLSGGQRQRVAMGRAIVRQPQAFLMDEPLSNLDAKLRVQMRAEIARLQRDLGVTTIYVTHDQTEAMTLGDRVAVMNKGVLQQVAPPQELYDRPANIFVAGFIGSPAMNLLRGTLRRDPSGWLVEVAGHTLPVPESTLAARPALTSYDNRDVILGIRPEDLSDADHGGMSRGVLAAEAELVEALGSDLMVHFTVRGADVDTEQTRDLAKDSDVDTLPSDGTVVVARFSPRSRVREGGPVRAAVDMERVHYFDPHSGTSIWSAQDAAASAIREEQP